MEVSGRTKGKRVPRIYMNLGAASMESVNPFIRSSEAELTNPLYQIPRVTGNHQDHLLTRDRSRSEDLLSRSRFKGFSDHRAAERVLKFVAYVRRPDSKAGSSQSRIVLAVVYRSSEEERRSHVTIRGGLQSTSPAATSRPRHRPHGALHKMAERLPGSVADRRPSLSPRIEYRH
jgi:hypothetical protein